MFRKYIYIFILLTVFACSKDEAVTYGDSYVGFFQPTFSYNFIRTETGEAVLSRVKVMLIAAPTSTPINYTFEIIPDGTTAIEGIHYTVDSNTGTIAANTNLGDLPIKIYPDNTDVSENPVIKFRLTGADLPVGVNFDEITFDYTVSCPVDDDLFLGDYEISYIDDQLTGLFGAATFGPEGTVVTLTSGGSTVREFEFTHLAGLGIGQPTATFSFNLFCQKVKPLALERTNLSCANGTPIGMGPVGDNDLAPFDPENDAVFDIIFESFVPPNHGDCGVSAVQETIRLTKQ